MIEKNKNKEKIYRKKIGFKNQSDMKSFFSAKDITDSNINWQLIHQYNQRLIDLGNRIKSVTDSSLDIEKFINDRFDIIKSNNLINKLNNNGRTKEQVYFKMTQGYLAVLLFKPFIEKKLNCELIDNPKCGDYIPSVLTDSWKWERNHEFDLYDPNKKIYVDVQAAFTKLEKMDIKQHKLKRTESDYEYYVACFDLYDARYCIIDTKNISETDLYKNPSMENQLCYAVPKNLMEYWF